MAVRPLFRLHSFHHFCYSLSSIPLHGGCGSRGTGSPISNLGRPVSLQKIGISVELGREACGLTEIEAVSADKRKRKEFVELPYTLHRNDPYWVPPLRMAVNE